MAKKNRMGKGLDEIFADNSVDTSAREEPVPEDGVTTVRLSLLEPNRTQPRGNFDEEKLRELADSIKENGVLQPILVRPLENGGYQIVAGERRWRASRLAGLTEVPVYIKELDDRQTMQMALIENIQRQDLSPIEEAKAYRSLMEGYGMTQQEVAQAVGKSRSAVANSVRLLSLCDQVRKMLEDGMISVGHAKVLASLDEEKQLSAAIRAEEDDLTVRELEGLVLDMNTPAPEYDPREVEALRNNSVRKIRPFLKEFELSVNGHSNVKARARGERDGGAVVTLKIGKELDTENILSRLAELLSGF